VAEEKILNISKLKIVCKNCKTTIETDLGTTIMSCPACETKFGINREDGENYFTDLHNVLTKMKLNKTADFIFVCEED